MYVGCVCVSGRLGGIWRCLLLGVVCRVSSFASGRSFIPWSTFRCENPSSKFQHVRTRAQSRSRSPEEASAGSRFSPRTRWRRTEAGEDHRLRFIPSRLSLPAKCWSLRRSLWASPCRTHAPQRPHRVLRRSSRTPQSCPSWLQISCRLSLAEPQPSLWAVLMPSPPRMKCRPPL